MLFLTTCGGSVWCAYTALAPQPGAEAATHCFCACRGGCLVQAPPRTGARGGLVHHPGQRAGDCGEYLCLSFRHCIDSKAIEQWGLR